MALDYNTIAPILQSWLQPGGPFSGAQGGPSFNPGGGVRGAHPLGGRRHHPAVLGQPPTSSPFPPGGVVPEPLTPLPPGTRPAFPHGIPPEPLTPPNRPLRPVGPQAPALPQNLQHLLQQQLPNLLRLLQRSGTGFESFSGPKAGAPELFPPLPPSGAPKSDLPASAPGLFPSGSAPPQNSQEMQQMMQQLRQMLQQMGLGGEGQSPFGYPLANVADQQTGVFPSYQL